MKAVARLSLFAQPIGLVAYAGVQLLLLLYFIMTGGLALGGEFALAQSIIAPAFILLSFSLRQVFVSKGKSELGLDYRALVTLRLASTALGTLLALAVFSVSGLELHPAPFLLVLTLKIQESLADILYARLDSDRRSWLAGLLQTLKAGAISLTLALCVLLHLPTHLAAAMIGGVAVACLLAETLVVLRSTRFMPAGPRPRLGALFGIVRSLAWISAANVIISLSGFLPRYALEAFAGRASVGLFAALTLPITFLILVCTGLAQTSLLELSDMVRRRRGGAFLGEMGKLLGLVAGVALILAVTVFAGGTALLRIVGKTVDPAATIMAAFILIYLPAFAAQIVSYVFLTLRNYRTLALINAAALAAQLALAWPLIRFSPVYGAAFLAVVPSLIQLAGFSFFMTRFFRAKAPA